MYIHASKKEIKRINFENITLNIFFKPNGLWYTNNKDWINWCKKEQFCNSYKYFYEVKIEHTDLNNPDIKKILYLKTIEDLVKFTEIYGQETIQYHQYNVFINWSDVSKLFGGIEINMKRIDHDDKYYDYLWWQSLFDVSSGCIWNMNALISIKSREETKYLSPDNFS